MNKPVAWTDGNGHYFDKNSFFPVDDLIPLYTHPVKELTDEEIMEVKKTVEYNQFMTAGEYAFNVAKAVLRKAQEK